MSFFAWLGTAVVVAIGAAVALFRRGGPYNPVEPENTPPGPIPPETIVDTTATSIVPPAPVLSQPTPFPRMIEKWANAITKWEGANPISNNPGNLKYSTLTASWGGTMGHPAADGGHFCHFATPQAGHNALCHLLILAAQNQLIAYHQARTLRQFTVVFAGNPPEGYIKGICDFLGVGGGVLISSFLS